MRRFQALAGCLALQILAPSTCTMLKDATRELVQCSELRDLGLSFRKALRRITPKNLTISNLRSCSRLRSLGIPLARCTKLGVLFLSSRGPCLSDAEDALRDRGVHLELSNDERERCDSRRRGRGRSRRRDRIFYGTLI